MAEDMSVVFKAQDQLTQEIQKMRSSVKKFGKDIQEYKAIQDKAFKEKAELQLDFKKAKEELKEIAKLEKQGVEGSKEAYISKQKEINEMQEGLKRYTQVINEANKAEKELNTTKSRNNNNPNKGNGDVVGFGKQLVATGMFKEVASSVGQLGGTMLSSQFGDRVGSNIGNGISSVLSMSAMGAAVGGPIGALVGAGVGAIKGVIDSENSGKQTRDDYFKNYTQEFNNKAWEQQGIDVNTGSALANQREKDIISFKNLLGGPDKAENYLRDVDRFGASTPYEIQDILNLSKAMLTYGYKQEEMIPTLTKLGDAFNAIGVDTAGQLSAVTALGRMRSSDKVTLENTNILQDKGIDAIGILANKMKTSKDKVYEMISKGALDGSNSVKVIVDTVGDKYKGAMEDFSKTYEGMQSTLSDAVEQVNRGYGEGFNVERKKGIQNQSYFYSFNEDELKKGKENIGKFYASLENAKESAQRKAWVEMQGSKEYRDAKAKNDGAKLGELEIRASIKAQTEYENSEGAKLLYESKMSTVKSTQQYITANGNFIGWGRELSEQFTKGWNSGLQPKMPNDLYKSDISTTSRKSIGRDTREIGKYAPGRATGGRIVGNNVPTLLHDNERVLTARENREYEQKTSGNNIVIENLNVETTLSKENIDAVVIELVTKFSSAVENLA